MNFCRMTWLYLINLLRSGTVRIAAAFLLCVALLFGLALPKPGNSLAIGLVSSRADALSAAVSDCLAALPGYSVQLYPDRAALKRAVVREEVLCGFAVAPDAGKKLQRGSAKGLLEGYYPRGTAAAMLINEAVGGAVARVTAPLAAARYLDSAHILPAGVDAMQYVTEYTQRALAEGSFITVELTFNGGVAAPARNQLQRLGLAALSGVFLIFAVLLGAEGPETGGLLLRAGGVSAMRRVLPLMGGWFLLSAAAGLLFGLLLGLDIFAASRGCLVLGAAGAPVALAGWRLRRYRAALMSISPVAALATVLFSGGLFSTALLGGLAPLRFLSLGWYYLAAVFGGM